MQNDTLFMDSFFKVFTQPRKTIQDILEKDSNFGVWPLVLSYSAIGALSPMWYATLSKHLILPLALAVGFILHLLFGVVFFLIVTGFNYGIGKLLGGIGTLQEIKAAQAWAYPPGFVAMLLLLASQAPYWLQVLNGETSMLLLLKQPKAAWQILCVGVSYFFMIWSFVLTLINLSQAHKFSVGKAILVALIMFVIMLILALAIGILAYRMIWMMGS